LDQETKAINTQCCMPSDINLPVIKMERLKDICRHDLLHPVAKSVASQAQVAFEISNRATHICIHMLKNILR
jgi:hypothetical protein